VRPKEGGVRAWNCVISAWELWLWRLRDLLRKWLLWALRMLPG